METLQSKTTLDWRNAPTQDLCTKTHSQEAEIGFQLPLLHYVSFVAASAASLLERISRGLKRLKYFTWNVTLTVFLIKSLPSIARDLQDGFSAEEDSADSTDIFFSCLHNIWIWLYEFEDAASYTVISALQEVLHLLLCTARGAVPLTSVLDPMGTYFGPLFPGHKGLILILSNGQSWRVQFRI